MHQQTTEAGFGFGSLQQWSSSPNEQTQLFRAIQSLSLKNFLRLAHLEELG